MKVTLGKSGQKRQDSRSCPDIFKNICQKHARIHNKPLIRREKFNTRCQSRCHKKKYMTCVHMARYVSCMTDLCRAIYDTFCFLTHVCQACKTYVESVTYTSGQNTKPKKKYRHKSNMTDIYRVCHIHNRTKYQTKKKRQTQVEHDRHMSCLSHTHPDKIPNQKKNTDTSRT